MHSFGTVAMKGAPGSRHCHCIVPTKYTHTFNNNNNNHNIDMLYLCLLLSLYMSLAVAVFSITRRMLLSNVSGSWVFCVCVCCSCRQMRHIGIAFLWLHMLFVHTGVLCSCLYKYASCCLYLPFSFIYILPSYRLPIRSWSSSAVLVDCRRRRSCAQRNHCGQVQVRLDRKLKRITIHYY